MYNGMVFAYDLYPCLVHIWQPLHCLQHCNATQTSVVLIITRITIHALNKGATAIFLNSFIISMCWIWGAELTDISDKSFLLSLGKKQNLITETSTLSSVTELANRRIADIIQVKTDNKVCFYLNTICSGPGDTVLSSQLFRRLRPEDQMFKASPGSLVKLGLKIKGWYIELSERALA